MCSFIRKWICEILFVDWLVSNVKVTICINEIKPNPQKNFGMKLVS